MTVLKRGKIYTIETKDGLTGEVLWRGGIAVRQRDADTMEGVSDTTAPAILSSSLTRVGTVIRDGGGSYDPPFAIYPDGELRICSRATTHTTVTHNNGFKPWMESPSHVVRKESIDTAFGKILAIKMVVTHQFHNGNRNTLTLWFDPGWGYSVCLRREARSARGGAPDIFIGELLTRERCKGWPRGANQSTRIIRVNPEMHSYIFCIDVV